MQLLELTNPTTAENLSLDEVLTDRCESSGCPREVLRIWENPVPAVILGRSSKVQLEVNREWCRANGVDVYRRSSGGASVVVGPGCLMYSVVLDYRFHPELRLLDRVHEYVMKKLATSLVDRGLPVEFQGTCDLTLDGRKFSGNSLRCRRNCLLYHGTLLYDFPLELVANCLQTPPRQPEYRAGRRHEDFLTNLPVQRQLLTASLKDVWPTTGPYDLLDLELVGRLAVEKYLDEAWTNKI